MTRQLEEVLADLASMNQESNNIQKERSSRVVDISDQMGYYREQLQDELERELTHRSAQHKSELANFTESLMQSFQLKNQSIGQFEQAKTVCRALNFD